MTKRRDVLAQIARYAKDSGQELRIVEGGNHTRVWVGERYCTVPRHKEIPDRFARMILKQVGVDK